MHNPLNLQGIEFIEFASPDPEALRKLFLSLGFSRVATHRDRPIDLYVQNDIRFVLNRAPGTHAANFARAHGPSICAMAWRTGDADYARDAATLRGATSASSDYRDARGRIPAVEGVGGSLIYFVDSCSETNLYESLGFVLRDDRDHTPTKGFLTIDHLTNNVEKGTRKKWVSFYCDVFGFTEVRYFDIRGEKTGLVSNALRSPCTTFSIPINEATDKHSQINEFIEEYHGAGIQHVAFLTRDILASLEGLDGSSVEFLDIDPDYYTKVFGRVPGVKEDHALIQKRSVLVDGDAEGYLLQIFTKNMIGPIFFELIQRQNHLSFGEGNFGALFRSIERDQMRRGVFADAQTQVPAERALPSEAH